MRGRITVLALALLAVASPAWAGSFVEEFTTTTYRDAGTTTADWDTTTGVVRLFPLDVLNPLATFDAGSDVTGVDIWGDHGYVTYAGSPGVDVGVVDISDPSTPVPAGVLDTQDPRDVTLVGDRAYVADGTAGLRIFDITNPAASPQLGIFATGGVAQQVVVRGGLAYVACGSAGLRILDVSNPATPSLVGQFVPATPVVDVALAGIHAFVAEASTAIHVLDIDDPALPVAVGSYSGVGDAQRIDLDGDRIYIADRLVGVIVLDVSEPTVPVFAGFAATGGQVLDVEVDGDYLYVADDTAGLVVLDVTHSGSIATVDAIATAGTATRVVREGVLAFVADRTGGLQVIEVAITPSSLRAAGPNLLLPGYPNKSDVFGNLGFVALNGGGALSILDLTDPQALTILSTYFGPGTARSVVVDGEYAYIGTSSTGLEILDVSDPTAPTLVGTINPGNFLQDLTIDGTLLYGAHGSLGLQIFDVSDRSNPALIGSYATANATEVIVQGDLAYVGDNGTLQILDVSNPVSPSFRGSLTVGARGIDLQGDLLAAAGGSSGFSLVDITSTTAPALLHAGTSSGFVYDVRLDGDLLYVSEGNAGLRAYDVSDPTSPTLLATSDYTPIVPFVVHTQIIGDFALTGLSSTNSLMSMTRIRGRTLDYGRNVAQSLEVDGADESIRSVRLQPFPEDVGMTFEVSANGGLSWQSVVPSPFWQSISAVGTELLWRGTFTGGAGPSTSSLDRLELEWLGDAPEIETVEDIPQDEGRQVRVTWRPSAFDQFGSTTPILDYVIYRRIDPLPKAAPPGDWDFVCVVPAGGQPTYSKVVPTLADSTIVGGQHLSTFYVRALSDTPGLDFDSPPVAGYSVDNLAPPPPTSFTAVPQGGSGNQLDWDPSPVDDFDYFRIYRSGVPGFTPGPANLVHETIADAWFDSGAGGAYYQIHAVDFSGNEGGYSGTAVVTGVPVLPTATVLHQNRPNPFNPATTIRFDLPARADVVLDVFDVAGRRVARLVDATLPAGPHVARWDAGGLPTGAYFYRLDAGGPIVTRKAILLK